MGAKDPAILRPAPSFHGFQCTEEVTPVLSPFQERHVPYICQFCDRSSAPGNTFLTLGVHWCHKKKCKFFSRWFEGKFLGKIYWPSTSQWDFAPQLTALVCDDCDHCKGSNTVLHALGLGSCLCASDHHPHACSHGHGKILKFCDRRYRWLCVLVSFLCGPVGAGALFPEAKMRGSV